MGQEVHGNYIKGFSKKNCPLSHLDHFKPLNNTSFGSVLMIFLKILHNGRGQEVGQKYVYGLFAKKCFRANAPFWVQKMKSYHNSGSTLRIF